MCWPNGKFLLYLIFFFLMNHFHTYAAMLKSLVSRRHVAFFVTSRAYPIFYVRSQYRICRNSESHRGVPTGGVGRRRSSARKFICGDLAPAVKQNFSWLASALKFKLVPPWNCRSTLAK